MMPHSFISFFIEKKYLIITLLIYFIIQIIFVLVGGLTPTSDGLDYIRIAKEAINRGELYPSIADFKSYFIWNIGTINLVALSLKTFNSVMPVLILYSLMNTLSALYLFLFTKKITNKTVAWLCLLIFIFYLSNLAHVSTILSETPSFFFIMAGFYLSMSEKKYLNVLGGVFLVVGNWFRSLMIIFLPILIYHLYKQKAQKKLIPIGIGIVITLCVIGGEVYSRTGRFIFQGDTSWYNIAMTCDDSGNGAFNDKVFEKGESMYIEGRDTMDYKEINQIYKERSISYALNNPVKMIKQIPYRIFVFYLNDTSCMWAFVSDKKMKTDEEIYKEGDTKTLWSKFPNYAPFQYILIFSQLYYYIILITFILGVIKAYKNKAKNLTTPFLIIIIGSALITAVISINRYHQPFIPFMMIFSAYYLADLKFFKKLKTK